MYRTLLNTNRRKTSCGINFLDNTSPALQHHAYTKPWSLTPLHAASVTDGCGYFLTTPRYMGRFAGVDRLLSYAECVIRILHPGIVTRTQFSNGLTVGFSVAQPSRFRFLICMASPFCLDGWLKKERAEGLLSRPDLHSTPEGGESVTFGERPGIARRNVRLHGRDFNVTDWTTDLQTDRRDTWCICIIVSPGHALHTGFTPDR
jgi:hypothetical protein